MIMAAPDRDRLARARRAESVLERLPAGTTERAGRSLREAMTLLGRSFSEADLDREATEHVVRPLLLVDEWPDPTPPLRLPVSATRSWPEAVHADLTDIDQESFATLRAILAERTEPLDAEGLATEAQQWRLAVTPYRTLARPNPAFTALADRPTTTEAVDGERRDLTSARVIDLSALWAGPLATKMLAGEGASVVKVDPSCRPDALREHASLYQHLNGDKEIIDLDLRRDPDRRRFEALLSEADLLIDSYSRRVLPNLGYGQDALRQRFPNLSTLSITAFPRGSAEQDWISYGPGVHAASGLADPTLGSSSPSSSSSSSPSPSARLGPASTSFGPAPIAYPDALAGLEAFARATALLTKPANADRRHHSSCHVEVALAGAIAPLVTRARATIAVTSAGEDVDA